MPRGRRRALGRLGAACVAALPGWSGATPQRWDLATGYPATSFHVQNLQGFASDLSARTAGELSLQVHDGDRLVKTPEIVGKVRSAHLMAGEVFGPSLGAVHPVFALDAVPFLCTSYAQARRLWNLARPLAERRAQETGLSLLYSVPWPPQGLFTAREIGRAEDLKGLPMRENSPYVRRLAEILGAQPTRVETPELAAAVRSGRVKAVFTSAAQGVDTRIWETLPWFYPLNAWLPRNAVIVNRDRLQALPQALRDQLLRAASAAEERGWALSARNADESLQALRTAGAKVGPPSGGLRARLDRAGGDLIADVFKRSDADTIGVLSRYLAELGRG